MDTYWTHYWYKHFEQLLNEYEWADTTEKRESAKCSLAIETLTYIYNIFDKSDDHELADKIEKIINKLGEVL